MKRRASTFIQSSKEDGVTIFKIEGLEDHPKAYKYTYDSLIKKIDEIKMKILMSGQPLPIVRVYHSLEIH